MEKMQTVRVETLDRMSSKVRVTKAAAAGSVAKAGVRERQVPAVERAIAILRLLGRSDTPLGVNAIARELDLVPSTCLHILRVLVAQELAAFDADTKRYQLDAGILSIARGLLRRNSVSQIVQASLDRLSKRYAVTTNAVRVTGLDHGTVVAMSRAGLALHIHVDVGSRFPALISVTGRCIAAFGDHDWGEIERRFATLRWDKPPSFRTWCAQVEETRRKGYAVDAGTYISGVTIIGAPMMKASRVSHVMVGVGLTEQFKPSTLAALGKDLAAVAAEASERLERG
jgi:DNA-binding IclR family transcriptional regulator